MRMTEAIREYEDYQNIGKKRRKTIADQTKDLSYFSLCHGNPDIEQIKHRDVVNYLQSMTEHGWAPSTRQNIASALRQFFRYLRNLDYTVVRPEVIPMPEVDYGIPDYVSEQEFTRMIDHLSHQPQTLTVLRDIILIRMLWETGARKGELLSIRLENIKWNDDQPCVLIKTEKAKEHTRRFLVWSKKTHKQLLEFAKQFDFHGPLLVSHYQRREYRPLSADGAAKRVENIAAKAGIERHIHPHMFRHAYAVRNVQKNKSMYAISTAMGHNDVRSSYRYARLYGDAQKQMSLELLDE